MFVPVTCKVTIDARFYACSCAARLELPLCILDANG